MSGDQLTIIGHHAGNGPAELGHAGGDLGHLVSAVDLGVAGIGPQPVNRPGLDLAGRKDEVHGRFSFGASGRAEARRREGQQQNRDPRYGENESAREGFLWAQFFDDQGVGQGGQLCQMKNARRFNSFSAGGFRWLASGVVASTN